MSLRRISSIDSTGRFQRIDENFQELFRSTMPTPYDFDAVGDGVADDTQAIQDWVDYCGTNGLVGFLAKGNFLVPEDTITLPNSFQSIGSGNASKIIRSVDIANPLILATSRSNIHVRGWYLRYTASTITSDGGNIAFRFKSCSNCTIEKSEVNGPFYVGIGDEDGTGCSVISNIVNGVLNRGIYPSARSGSFGSTVLGNQVNGAAVYTIVDPDTSATVSAGSNLTAYAINVNGYGTGIVKDYIIHGNSIYNCQFQGVQTGDQCYGSITANHIENVTGGAEAVGILVQQANGNASTDVVVSGNRVIGCGIGIQILNTSWVTVTGNVINSSTDTSGIIVQNSDNCTISANVSRDNTERGIYVVSESSHLTIVGNVTEGNTLSGIAVSSADATIISANTCNNNGGNGVSFVSSTNSIVTSNSFDSNTGTGLTANNTNDQFQYGMNRSTNNGTAYSVAATNLYNLGTTAGTSNR